MRTALVSGAGVERIRLRQVGLNHVMAAESAQMSLGEEVRFAKEVAPRVAKEPQALPGKRHGM